MNLEHAYEAATRAEFNHWGPSWPTLTYETDVEHREYLASQVERAVNAAAPLIAAQALRDFVNDIPGNEYTRADLIGYAYDLETK